jgi:hypothetical protein
MAGDAKILHRQAALLLLVQPELIQYSHPVNYLLLGLGAISKMHLMHINLPSYLTEADHPPTISHNNDDTDDWPIATCRLCVDLQGEEGGDSARQCTFTFDQRRRGSREYSVIY